MPKNAVTEIWGPQGRMIGFYPHGDNGLIATCCTMPIDQPGTSDTHEERVARMKREFKYVIILLLLLLLLLVRSVRTRADLIDGMARRGWGGVVPEILEALDSCVDLQSDDLLEVRRGESRSVAVL